MMSFAGLLATTEKGSMLLTTTDPAPMTELSQICTAPMITELHPMSTLFPMIGATPSGFFSECGAMSYYTIVSDHYIGVYYNSGRV